MAITIQFLLGLLLVTQICCLQDIEFRLQNGMNFRVYDTSVELGVSSPNGTHVEIPGVYKIKGAIGSEVKNLALNLKTVHRIENVTGLNKCETSLESPTDEFSQEVFRALENLIYNTTCLNGNDEKRPQFDQMYGNNEVHFNTIMSSNERVEEFNRDTNSKCVKHEQGVNALADVALDFIKEKFELSYIPLGEIVTRDSDITLRNLTVGNLATLTRTGPFEIYRNNDSLTVDSTFKIRTLLSFTAKCNSGLYSWKDGFPEANFAVFAEKIEVRIKLTFDYSVEPCRIKLIDMNSTNGKLAIDIINMGALRAFFNKVSGYSGHLKKSLTQEELFSIIKSELQKLLDREDSRSEADLLRPIFVRV